MAGDTGVCWLCEEQRRLISGHVSPRFVVNWIKETSATGILNAGLEPGVPRQDGIRMFMFCEQCEQILSKDEKSFAEQVFQPRHSSEAWEGFEYGPWLLRFAVGLALRCTFEHSDELAEYRASLPGPGNRYLHTRAIPDWRAFLLDQADRSGGYEFHLLLVDYIRRSTSPVAEHIQYYLMRATDQTYVWSPKGKAALYTLLPGFVFWVPIVPKKQAGWSGTRIRWKGRMSAGEQREGGDVFTFMNERAQAIAEMGSEMSPEQVAAITRRMQRAGDRLLASKSAEARLAELSLRAPPGRPDGSRQLPPSERLASDRTFVRQQTRKNRRRRPDSR